nr:MAG TPA: hypothetical protein [Caudoviricetes sp.]
MWVANRWQILLFHEICILKTAYFRDNKATVSTCTVCCLCSSKVFNSFSKTHLLAKILLFSTCLTF